MHIFLHALSLLVRCVTAMNINYNYQCSKLGDWSKTQHSTLRQCSSGLPDWLFWSQKPDIWLFWEAFGSKIFIWLFCYFLALLQLFRFTNFSWRRVASSSVASLRRSKTRSGPLHNCARHLWASAYGRGGVGVKTPPLRLIFYKTLLPAQKILIVFAYFLLVNLSTEWKYHGIYLHANFKEHCKWAKK